MLPIPMLNSPPNPKPNSLRLDIFSVHTLITSVSILVLEWVSILKRGLTKQSFDKLCKHG
ncbi:hypothetical protein DLM76_04850 [Leptospira yasudae]|nr:hypothetical protein DLM76_04850 [Leptospira yasudae]